MRFVDLPAIANARADDEADSDDDLDERNDGERGDEGL